MKAGNLSSIDYNSRYKFQDVKEGLITYFQYYRTGVMGYKSVQS